MGHATQEEAGYEVHQYYALVKVIIIIIHTESKTKTYNFACMTPTEDCKSTQFDIKWQRPAR